MFPKLLAVIVVGILLSAFAGAQEKAQPNKYATKVPPNVKIKAIANYAGPQNCDPANAISQFDIQPDGAVVITRTDGNKENLAPAASVLPCRPKGTGAACG